MKKFLAAAAFVAAFSASSSAFAIDSTGCGLGSILFKGHSGLLPQTLAVTTNGFFGNQTFGITTGTSGCSQNGTVSGGTGIILAFLENNMEQFALDAARGHGETIDTIASLMNLPSERVGQTAHDNFAVLFSHKDADAVSVSEKMASLLNG